MSRVGKTDLETTRGLQSLLGMEYCTYACTLTRRQELYSCIMKFTPTLTIPNLLLSKYEALVVFRQKLIEVVGCTPVFTNTPHVLCMSAFRQRFTQSTQPFHPAHSCHWLALGFSRVTLWVFVVFGDPRSFLRGLWREGRGEAA